MGQDYEFAFLDRLWAKAIEEAKGDWVAMESDAEYIERLYSEVIDECQDLRSRAMCGMMVIIPTKPWRDELYIMV